MERLRNDMESFAYRLESFANYLESFADLLANTVSEPLANKTWLKFVVLHCP
jgi:hypothetical protein